MSKAPLSRVMRRKHVWLVIVTALAIAMLVVLRQEEEAVLESQSMDSQEYEREFQPIKQISILGERNSGTRWTYSHLHKCFNHSLRVTRTLTRYKHWFQYEDPDRYLHDTLVVAQFRNPYDWLKAMEHVPHHSPAHLRLALNASYDDPSAQNNWQLFLTKPWTMPRIGKDLKLKGDEMCQARFHYRDIVSCVAHPLPLSAYNHTLRYSEHEPFYEMRNDGSGEPYASIMELRTDKIRNFLSTANYPGVADTWVVQYEYLLNKGTQHLLDRIAEWTGVEPRCEAFPPQNRIQKKSRYIDPDHARFIKERLNWTVEGWIGYQPDESLEYNAAPW